jgi:glyoxylase-like metal-dependent hydrolase (beta-lactamase superfamily II)
MAKQPLIFHFGAATMTILEVGTLRANLGRWLRVPEEQQAPEHRAVLERPILMPMQCVYIALRGAPVLVDACDPAQIAATEYAPPGYQPPPSLPAQLQSAGIAPDAIEHVAITHAHFDHYSGVVEPDSDTLAFPNARHYLRRTDWDDVRVQLADPATLESRTLGCVQHHGRLELVEGRREIAVGVTLIPAPGETPGHQIVRVESEGLVLYVLGDLYHHALEVARPEWAPYWSDGVATLRSRQALVATALAEDALLVAAHIPGVGRLHVDGSGVAWRPI